MPSQRQLRVGELLRHALAEILTREDVDDPDLRGVTVTVSEVAVGADLRRATAFVMPLGGGRANEVVAALNRARGFLRGRIGRQVELKYVPELDFALDTSFGHSDAVRELLASPPVRRDLGADSEG